MVPDPNLEKQEEEALDVSGNSNEGLAYSDISQEEALAHISAVQAEYVSNHPIERPSMPGLEPTQEGESLDEFLNRKVDEYEASKDDEPDELEEEEIEVPRHTEWIISIGG